MSFEEEVRQNIAGIAGNETFKDLSRQWITQSTFARYTYNFRWFGRPIIQFPQDMVAMQELVWAIKPDLIIETGIAHGGSLVMNAALLAMLDWAEAAEAGTTLDPRASKRKVLGIDIDIRAHNRAAIEAHPFASMIEMIEGSSVADDVIDKVRKVAAGYKRVLVSLDSNHTHEHVLGELELYAPLVSKGSYCVVFDTVVEDLPDELYPNRPWNQKDNPKTAVRAYLKSLAGEGRTAADGAPLAFETDREIETKLQITVAPEGFLKRV